MNHLILSNLAGIWSRGTFDPIIINGETISHTVHDLSVYIDSSINLADHFPRLTTKTCFWNLSISIYPSVAQYQIFAHLVRWLWLLSIIATDFLVENRAKCLISPLSGASEKAPCRTGWTLFSAKTAFRICKLAHPCLRGSAPPYLIPHASERHHWTHIRTSQIGCRGYVKISRPGSQTLTIGSWEFCYLLPFCMEHPPGRSSWSRIYPYNSQMKSQRIFV